MNDWIVPDWPAPANVRALFTTRNGGIGSGPYASFNLGDHVGDDPGTVRHHRAQLRRMLPGEPAWLRQAHGTTAVDIDSRDPAAPCDGDAAFSRRAGGVCGVLVADCLPILLCSHAGTLVGAIHAGWRGLAGGIVEQTISDMRRADPSGAPIMAWLGPAIGPARFEVGEDVHLAFAAGDGRSASAFRSHPTEGGKWLADIFLLARQRLARAGVTAIHGGGVCTFDNPDAFFSHRRDGRTGRMAALIWLER
ncbi:peptidoglycan editing factor PgeF [Nitrosovibrio sp. Nv17]|uniref:peptidoglycan editing factor PgeF n=1 Tax=Nitrosovibrio sp. Nv17 TaxID=1855339 RepID=UPI0009091382|nr:peptidoglycan editing factor PgeF [Nitrosovibrio sp. Nv17]SFW33511.1 conserved hypothetical protein [Nitrosovibrio sp. Nv17]